MRRITSRDNPLLQEVRRAVRQPLAYRRTGRVWLEGEHLGAALCAASGPPGLAVVSESALLRPPVKALLDGVPDVVVVPDRLYADLSDLPSPAGIGFLHDLGASAAVEARVPTIVLDRLQDAGNVGSLLRSAAAFGVGQVLALEGTAGLWSPKVLRAGMGAHFNLHLVEKAGQGDLAALGLPLVATSSHAATSLHDCALPDPAAWVFSHEGQGLAPGLEAACALTVRIPQPGGGESLNVAAAGAVCLYEAMRRRLAQ